MPPLDSIQTTVKPAMTGTAHWASAATAWEKVGSPLRPAKEDEAEYHRQARDWIARHGAPRVLLLGVTPEIHRLPWPEGHDFLAVDHSRAMIDLVWPGPRKAVLEASWLDLPLPPGSRDLAFCDGGLVLLEPSLAQNVLVDRLHEVLVPGGRCIFRLFALPPKKESSEAVLGDLFEGRIENLNVLKLRLGMALQESPETGIELRKVWRTLRDATTNWESLAAHLGWPLPHLLAIDVYRDSDCRLYYISIDRMKELFCRDSKFTYLGHRHPTYTLGERCPMVVFERL